MDLSKFDISSGEKGLELTILDLDNNPTNIKIKLLSLHSKKGREAFLELAKKGQTSTAQMLAALTIGWQGVEREGKEIKFSREQAIKIYDEYPSIAAQVERFVENAKNFIKK